jgi:hypothetical protein
MPCLSKGFVILKLEGSGKHRKISGVNNKLKWWVNMNSQLRIIFVSDFHKIKDFPSSNVHRKFFN